VGRGKERETKIEGIRLNNNPFTMAI